MPWKRTPPCRSDTSSSGSPPNLMPTSALSLDASPSAARPPTNGSNAIAKRDPARSAGDCLTASTKATITCAPTTYRPSRPARRSSKRRGWIDDEEAPKHRPYQRFEREAPNELWQMDFKGDFPLTGGGRCYPLTVLDDHSRFALALGGLLELAKRDRQGPPDDDSASLRLVPGHLNAAFCQRDRIPRLSCAFLPGKDDDARKPLAVAG